jgi:hypothetical protein
MFGTTEKAKLVRHHTMPLRQIGADDELVNELVARLMSRISVPQSRRTKPLAIAGEGHPQGLPGETLLGSTRISCSPDA